VAVKELKRHKFQEIPQFERSLYAPDRLYKPTKMSHQSPRAE